MFHFKKILLCLTLLSFNAFATATDIAVGGRAGTLGLGAEVIVGVFPTVNGRLGFNKFDFNYDGTESDVDYEIDLNLESWNALLDWYVFGSFHFTGGVLSNKNSLDVNASLKSGKLYTIGDLDFSSDQIGTLQGSLDFKKTAGYLGIGWGNPIAAANRLSINFDLGVVFQGAPDATLNASGGLLSDIPIFQENLRKEEVDIEEELDAFEYYPVLSLGVSFRF
jgi:hypothetical protein